MFISGYANTENVFNCLIVIFKSQKLRKELEDSQQKLSDVKAKLQSAESKSGWFERRLTEAEVFLSSFFFSTCPFFLFCCCCCCFYSALILPTVLIICFALIMHLRNVFPAVLYPTSIFFDLITKFKKSRRLLQRKRHIKIELCVWLSILRLSRVGRVAQNRRSALSPAWYKWFSCKGKE